MDGGTFTVSNGGVFGSLYGTPIINPPQSAILGMHGVFDRPVAIDGKVREREREFVYWCWLINYNSLIIIRYSFLLHCTWSYILHQLALRNYVQYAYSP